jgi:predicted transcriptional regulator
MTMILKMSDKKEERLYTIFGSRFFREILKELVYHEPLSIDELHERTGFESSEILRKLDRLIVINKVTCEEGKYSIKCLELKNTLMDIYRME